MQFIKNGPDIPNELLQAHEEGRVVFFCGAGISIPAGLPSFGTFVEKIYDLNGETKSDIEEASFNAGQLDTTLDQFERRLTGGREKLREVIPEILTPTPGKRGATKTHQALLQLGLSRDGHLRLVTTNYDRLFHVAAKKIKMPLKEYPAPSLPIPKKSRWDGLVFLHGVLPKVVTQNSDLNGLVMTSGDFGLAYLTERWAARFVTELFRNYVVVFVGYSINDSVLRYMMDALAADRRLGERTPQAWVFAECPPGEEVQKENEWKAKGVKPILYSSGKGGKKHIGLHKSLQAWAAAYTSGIGGKENIVLQLSLAHPQNSTAQDNFVGRLLWALSDPSGLPAKRFAESKPTPSLDWFFDVFTQNNFSSTDLPRFGITPSKEESSAVQFSMLNRPASYEFAAWMNLTGSSITKWDNVFYELAHWLTFYFNDPRLILWFSEKGGFLCPPLRNLFILSLESYSNLSKIDAEKFKKKHPFSIPSPRMEKLWRALFSGRMSREPEPFYRKNRLKIEGMSSIVRVDLRKRLAGVVILRKPFRLDYSLDAFDHLDCELILKDESVIGTIREALPDVAKEDLLLLISELEVALKDALDLIQELESYEWVSYMTYRELPSVSQHPQNQRFHSWVLLIELLRDCWLRLLEIDEPQAAQRASDWFARPQIAFKRLAFFAGSKTKVIFPKMWVAWLLTNDAFCLWAIDTKREVCRLIALQGNRLELRTQRQLESAILKGPPRSMYPDDLKPEQWNEIKEYAIWLRLIKLKLSGVALSQKSASCIKRISKKHPEWKTYKNEKEEFSYWLSDTRESAFDEDYETETPPTNLNDLIKWLRKYTDPRRFFFQDKWKDACLTDYDLCMQALIFLARKNEWPISPWQVTLQICSQGKTAERAWKALAPLVNSKVINIPSYLFPSFTSWLESISKIPVIPEKEILSFCRILLGILENFKVVSLSENILETEDAVVSAINKPAGHLAFSIIYRIFSRKLNDKDLLLSEFKEFLDLFCNPKLSLFAPARVILASHTISLFRIDPKWTEKYLLPFFDWKSSREARSVWQGFLWSPRLYIPLLHLIKTQLFETANHTEQLGRYRQQYATFLTYVALTLPEGITHKDLITVFRVFKREDLEGASQALLQAFQSADTEKEVYWDSIVRIFIQKIWPKSKELVSSRIAENFAQVAITSRNRFPEALKVVQSWIPSIKEPSMVIDKLEESGLCRDFPKESLSLLDSMISETTNLRGFWSSDSLTKCLSQISALLPRIREDNRFKKLEEFLRRKSV